MRLLSDAFNAVGSNKFLLQILDEKLTAAAVGKHEAKVLKMLGLLYIMLGHLL